MMRRRNMSPRFGTDSGVRIGTRCWSYTPCRNIGNTWSTPSFSRKGAVRWRRSFAADSKLSPERFSELKRPRHLDLADGPRRTHVLEERANPRVPVIHVDDAQWLSGARGRGIEQHRA